MEGVDGMHRQPHCEIAVVYWQERLADCAMVRYETPKVQGVAGLTVRR